MPKASPGRPPSARQGPGPKKPAALSAKARADSLFWVALAYTHAKHALASLVEDFAQEDPRLEDAFRLLEDARFAWEKSLSPEELLEARGQTPPKAKRKKKEAPC